MFSCLHPREKFCHDWKIGSVKFCGWVLFRTLTHPEQRRAHHELWHSYSVCSIPAVFWTVIGRSWQTRDVRTVGEGRVWGWRVRAHLFWDSSRNNVRVHFCSNQAHSLPTISTAPYDFWERLFWGVIRALRASLWCLRNVILRCVTQQCSSSFLLQLSSQFANYFYSTIWFLSVWSWRVVTTC